VSITFNISPVSSLVDTLVVPFSREVEMYVSVFSG